MRIGIRPSALKNTRGKDYLLRFVFGGLITAIAGLIANKFGPVVAGLFLAFPAILPASLTLVEKHEEQSGCKKGQRACGVDAAGAAIGSLGLAAFGGVAWWLALRVPGWQMLLLAALTWSLIAVVLWAVRQKI